MPRSKREKQLDALQRRYRDFAVPEKRSRDLLDEINNIRRALGFSHINFPNPELIRGIEDVGVVTEVRFERAGVPDDLRKIQLPLKPFKDV